MKNSTQVATFGAAMAALYVAPTLHADIVSLSFAPATVAYGGTAFVPVLFNEVGVSAGQWNDSIGQTILAGSLDGGIAVATLGQSVAGSTFAGGGAILASASATGTVYIAFTHMGNAGWYSINLGGLGGDVTYLEGAYGTMGETVQVGVIPAPAGLALMAMGAAGIRSRRKRAA